MPETYRIAAAQMDVALGDKEHNLRRMVQVVAEAAAQGARLTVFPECALAGYCFSSLDEARPHAETIPGPATQYMMDACRQNDTHAIFGLLEADGDDVFNACAFVGPQGVVASYRKVHLPFLGVDRFAAPGQRPFAISHLGDLRVGMTICYDGSFPEPSRVLALAGADLIVLPTNWPPGAEHVAQHLPNTRAMENNVYYLAVNRIGTERGVRFLGCSKICGTSGEDLASAPHDGPAVLYANIDPERARRKRIVRVPDEHIIDRLGDRRPDFYAEIAKARTS